MNVETWSSIDEDPGRAGRLGIGYATGIVILTLTALAGASVRGAIKTAGEDENVVEVKLATSVAEPIAAPPPPLPVAAPQAAAPVAAMPRKAIVAPKEVPTEAPPESDAPAKPASGEDEYADGKGGVVGGVAGGTGTGPVPAVVAVVAPPPVAAPPPAPPKPSGPINLPEDATPPVALSNAQPAYPEEARQTGVEATIVVKFVVTESGEVTNVSIVRGHPSFDAAVLAAVRSWRYSPALFQGRPIQVYRVAKIPFRLRT